LCGAGKGQQVADDGLHGVEGVPWILDGGQEPAVCGRGCPTSAPTSDLPQCMPVQ
jgi:hypothetical protein